MGAGASALQHAVRSRLHADEYERLAREAREEAERYALASRTEASVAGKLQALHLLGWRVLEDRRWAGSKRANVDFLLVGPGGVVVVDVKAWRALEVRHNSVFCDDECRDDEVAKIRSLAERVQDSVSLLGLTHQALWPALVFAGRRVQARVGQVDLLGEANVAAWVTRLGQRLDEDQVAEVASVLEQDFPPYDQPAAEPVRVSRLRLVMPRSRERRGLEALDNPKEHAAAARVEQPYTPDQPSLFDVEELADSLLQNALAGPIEEWMTFLHPDQLRLVSSSWSGPARVRGPAGTGKTVVGLHRATYLAERSPRKILFVTYVKTLPNVLAGLCRRMSPTAAVNIEFTGLHRLALDILDGVGVEVRIDSRKIDTAFATAWATVGRCSVLTKLDERWSYWKEEIDYVIKGRGLTEFSEYAGLARLGRRTPMRAEHRAAMWDLYVEYDRRLRLAGAHDFTDALIMARDLVRDGTAKVECGAVVVDEVQDLNLVGLQLLHAIAGDGPDRLVVIGDGQQSVYPGGFTLSEAGISVKGRAAILRTNYRNTAEILEVAERVVAADTFDDLEGTPLDGHRDVEIRRRGGVTITVHARDQHSLEAALSTQIEDTRARLNVAYGDMAVLVSTRRELMHYIGVLRRAGVPCLDLMDYAGVGVDQVKVGTFKRAKGLEFKFVLLPGLHEGPPESWRGESDDSYRERAERMRRELYVGMTRARDGLWLGYLADASRTF